MKTSALFLLLAFLSHASSLLHWSPSLPDGKVLYACAGQEVDIPWAYTSGSGDVISVTKWTIQSGSVEMLAMLVDGNFMPMPAFANRVEHMGEAGLRFKGVTVSDAGNYSVEVIGTNASGMTFSEHHSVLLQVAADLMTTDHLLHVHQKDEALYSAATGEYHAVLSCGQFTFPSDPPFSVHWKTPSGQELASTSYKLGFFLLFLPSNVEDDSTYTCVIPQDALPDSCLHSNASKVDIRVNSVRAKMAVMDARQRHLESKMASVQSQNQVLQSNMSSVQSQNQALESNMSSVQSKNEALESKMASVQSQMATVQNENQDLKQQISLLQDCIAEESNTTIAFHTTLDHSTSFYNVMSGEKINMTDVITNEGGGYNATSGVFTAPLSGTYFFAASASPFYQTTSASMQLRVEGLGVAAVSWAHQTSFDDPQTGTCHAVVHLQAGQRVWLDAAADGSFRTGGNSFFSGFRCALRLINK